MQQNSTKNLFSDKKTRNKVSSNIFRGFEHEKMVPLMC